MADTETLTPEVEAAAKERVNGILHSQLAASLEAVPDAPQAPPARRPRSDKGIPRKQPAKPPTPVAAPVERFLSAEQCAHLDKLREDYFQAIEANRKAERAMLDASAAWYGYLNELEGASPTAKGGKA